MSEVLPDKEALWKRAQELAENIASKSPIAITGIKQSLNYSRDHTVQEGLEHIALINSGLLQSKDVTTAMMAGLKKQKAEFPKL